MAKRKILQDSSGQIFPITRTDCVYDDNNKQLTDTITSIQNSLGNKQDKLIYKDNVLVYKRFNEENAENVFEAGTNKMLVIESLNLEEGKNYSIKTLVDKIIPISVDSSVENMSTNVISFELKATAVKMEELGDMLGFVPIGFTITFGTENRDYDITVYDKLKADSVEDAPYYSEEHAIVFLPMEMHYIEIGVKENLESEVTDEFLETYKFVTQEEKDSWNNKAENSALNEIYSSLEDISAKVNEQLLYKEYFNTVDIDSITDTTFQYRGYLGYKTVDGLLGIESNKYYDLELVFSDNSIIKYSNLLSDDNKCISHDDGTILINVADDTFVSNNGSVNSYPGANKHSVYGYNITNLKQVKIYETSEVNNEFLETHKFVTEEEREKWNSKQNTLYYDIEKKAFQSIDLTNLVYSGGESIFETNTVNLIENEIYSVRATIIEDNEDIIYEGFFTAKAGSYNGEYDNSLGAMNFIYLDDGFLDININFNGFENTPTALPPVLQNMFIYDKASFDISAGYPRSVYNENKLLICFRNNIDSIKSFEIKVSSKETISLTTEALKEYKLNLITDEEKNSFAKKENLPIIKYVPYINHGGIDLSKAIAKTDSSNNIIEYNIDFDSVFNIKKYHIYKILVQLSDYSVFEVLSSKVDDNDFRNVAFFNFVNPINGKEINIAFRDNATSTSIIKIGCSYFEINDKDDIEWIELSCIPQEITTEYLKDHEFLFVTKDDIDNWNSKQDKEDANLNTEDKTIVGAINELNEDKLEVEDLPCYDNRVFEDCSVEYDGIEDGKEKGEIQRGPYAYAYFVKVADLSEEEYDTYKSALSNGYTITYEDYEETLTTVESDFVHEDETYGFLMLEGQYVMIIKNVVQISGNYSGNMYFPSAGIYFESSTQKFDFRKSTGELKTLDKKFLPSIVGETVEIGTTHGDVTDDENTIYTTQKGAEIFNNYDMNIATGMYSHAEGNGSSAFGDHSHAEGEFTVASGMGSHAEGEQCRARGEYSHVEGTFTQAIGAYSHAEGNFSNAIGQNSHAEGGATRAYGDNSHTEGSNTYAYGYASHAEGSTTIASGDYQHVQGKYNIEDTENIYAHIVGNGTTQEYRKNAHTLDWEGNAWFAGNVSIGTDNKQLATEEFVNNAINNIEIPEGFSGDYNDLTNIPEIPSIEGLATEEFVNDAIDNIPEGFSGDYNDLINKPEMPSTEGLATEELVNNLNNDVVESINEINTELKTKASTEFVNAMLGGLRLIQMTQSEYDALEVKDSNTLYIIVN